MSEIDHTLALVVVCAFFAIACVVQTMAVIVGAWLYSRTMRQVLAMYAIQEAPPGIPVDPGVPQHSGFFDPVVPEDAQDQEYIYNGYPPVEEESSDPAKWHAAKAHFAMREGVTRGA